jgi:hypothetical protein
MSAYIIVQTKFYDASCILQTLADMGYAPRVCQQEEHLEGFRGDKREQTAKIIVPRAQIGCASNDIGFHWNGKSFDLIISEYDVGHGYFNQKFFKQKYAVNKVLKEVKTLPGYLDARVRETKEGKAKLFVRLYR